MARKPRERKQYGNVRLADQASLWQGDDNRNFGNLVAIEKAFFTIPDVQDLPKEILTRLKVRSSQNSLQHLLEANDVRFGSSSGRDPADGKVERKEPGLLPVLKELQEHGGRTNPTDKLLQCNSKYMQFLAVSLHEWLRFILQKATLYSSQLQVPQPSASGQDDTQGSNGTSCTNLARSTAATDRTILVICAGLLSTWLGRSVSIQDIIRFLARCKDDQLITILTFMLGLAVYQRICTRFIARLPASRYLTFEDAYGHTRPMSMDVCVDFSILRQFMEVHYRNNKAAAGEALVKAGRFHMLLGSRRGRVISMRDWAVSGRIQSGSRIVNSVYIDSEDTKCLHCQQDLVVSKIGEFHCMTCQIFHRDYENLQNIPEPKSDKPQSNELPRQRHEVTQPTTVTVDAKDVLRIPAEPIHEHYDLHGLKNLDIRVVARHDDSNRVSDMTGQTVPPGTKPKVDVDFWEILDDLVVHVNGVYVIRDQKDDFIDALALLEVIRVDKPQRDMAPYYSKVGSVAEHSKPASRTGRLGPAVWIPLSQALELANMAGVTDMLYPLFVHDIVKLMQGQVVRGFGYPKTPRDVYVAELGKMSTNSDQDALARFRHLNGNFSPVPDIVDSEPSTEKLYRRLLGIISEHMDSMSDTNTDDATVESSRLTPTQSLSSRSETSREADLLQRRTPGDSRSRPSAQISAVSTEQGPEGAPSTRSPATGADSSLRDYIKQRATRGRNRSTPVMISDDESGDVAIDDIALETDDGDDWEDGQTESNALTFSRDNHIILPLSRRSGLTAALEAGSMRKALLDAAPRLFSASQQPHGASSIKSASTSTTAKRFNGDYTVTMQTTVNGGTVPVSPLLNTPLRARALSPSKLRRKIDTELDDSLRQALIRDRQARSTRQYAIDIREMPGVTTRVVPSIESDRILTDEFVAAHSYNHRAW